MKETTVKTYIITLHIEKKEDTNELLNPLFKRIIKGKFKGKVVCDLTMDM